MQNYKHTLDFLYQQLPMFQKVGKSAFKKDLRNIVKLCHFLGHPHRHFLSIHVAGTNGKGSVSHFIASILQASGLRVGLYTSPHYRDFRERIKINGTLISEEQVVDFVGRIRSLIASVRPSFFEISVAMAFDYFSRQDVDVAVIETGLGGRLDSTNIVEPILSVITNISYDHQEFLGDTLAEIATEKAGIIKYSVPVLIGRRQSETSTIFVEAAKQNQSPLFFAEDICRVDLHLSEGSFQQVKVRMMTDIEKKAFTLKLGAPGPYQIENARTSIAAIQLLTEKMDLGFDDRHIVEGLQRVREATGFLGRWQILGEKPHIIADSAHNEAGIKLAVEFLMSASVGNLHMVIGVVKDKDFTRILSLLPENATYYFCAAQQPRALSAKDLKATAAEFGLRGRAYGSVKEALNEAKRAAMSKDIVFVGGSTFVTAEVV